MKTLEEVMKTQTATTEEMLSIYDSLPAVTADFMIGRWKGTKIESNHQMNGMLKDGGWYGKIFNSEEEVHPLVFFGSDKKSLYSINPRNIPLHLKFPKSKLMGILTILSRPFFQTRKPKARLRMVEHRGKLTATMLYDDKAIYDHFVKIDDNTVLGYMDLKGVADPVFWTMERDDRANYKLLF